MNIKKIFSLILVFILFLGAYFTFEYIKANKRYETVDEAIFVNKEVKNVIHKEVLDDFTMYLYQPKDEPILVDYVYQDQNGYKAPSKLISKQSIREHQTIWHYEEKAGKHLVVIYECPWNPEPFTITDNLNSNFKTINVLYEGFEYSYYLTTFDDDQEYEIYIDGELVSSWNKF